MTAQVDLHKGRRRISDEPSSTNVPFFSEKFRRVQWLKRESPFDKCLKESPSGMDKGLWETPNQTTDSDPDKESRFNEVRLKAQLYRVYRVYIGKGPKQNGPCVSK